MSTTDSVPMRTSSRKAAVHPRAGTFAILLVAAAALMLPLDGHAAVIFVTNTEQIIGSTGCSLPEAIYSANLDENKALRRIVIHTGEIEDAKRFEEVWISTLCEAGSGSDIIVLPAKAEFLMTRIIDDPYNPFGPTATPIIMSAITIEAQGALLLFSGGSELFRLFAIGSTGNLTLKSAHIKGFAAKGGDGGPGGGGGGLGAGGAIYVHAGVLTVQNSTFEGNGAMGGNGGAPATLTKFGGETYSVDAGGGGGGLGGNGGAGGDGDCIAGFPNVGNGAGGGGSRGDGWYGGGCEFRAAGGTGGGTFEFRCGGRGGHFDGPIDGGDGRCSGGGGGGGSQGLFDSGHGGVGAYGGGGGGGAESTDGGNGGFGGGGGAGWEGVFGGSTGGRGGFGGGGGAGPNGPITDGTPGAGGLFGGHATSRNGGGGAALGGAIFNDSGEIHVRNSTFAANFASRGNGGNAPNAGQGANGADAGAAIFSRNGRLTIQYSTISGNEGTGSRAGVAIVRDGQAQTYFTLQNTIIANNGASECSILGSGVVTEFVGNLIEENDNCGTPAITADPDLGPLADNQGPTPTMGIAGTSPAKDAADGSVTVETDQRGQGRPVDGGYDIGAFELCVFGPLQKPCLIVTADFTFSPISPLTIPAGGSGATTVVVNANSLFSSEIALSGTGFPSGAVPTFTPSSVTPASSSSASSQLTVSLGPTVLPGSYSVNVVGISGILRHMASLDLTVLPSFEGTSSIIDVLEAKGCIDNGVSDALQAKLTAAYALINAGQIQQAINTLKALLNQLHAQAGKHIGTCTVDGQEVDAFTTLAQQVEALLNSLLTASLKPNPITGSVMTSTGRPAAGATISVFNSAKKPVMSAISDAAGFFYFANVNALNVGADYTISVSVPKGYSSSAPRAQTFRWARVEVAVPTFALY